MFWTILNIERVKTLFSPSFRTIIILHASLFALIVLVAGSIQLNIQGVQIEKVLQFPHVWNTLAWIASWFNLLLGILAIMLVTNEFQFRTFRKQIIDGLTRDQLLVGKTAVFSILAIYTTTLVFAAGLIMGIAKSPSYNLVNIIEGLNYLPVLFVQSLAYMLLAMLMAFIFRNPAISIVSFILYFFPIEPILRAFTPDAIDKFFPAKVIANLTPMPDFVGISLGDMMQVIPGSEAEMEKIGLMGESMPLLYASIITIVYCILFTLVSRIIIMRKNF